MAPYRSSDADSTVVWMRSSICFRGLTRKTWRNSRTDGRSGLDGNLRALGPPLFEQARCVSADRPQARIPSECLGARAPNHLIERQRLGVIAHLRPRFVDRHVPDV